ncbi:hypothetical protein [Paenibacillus montanisoli]|uniref:Uncharacterized protein n=1 Tax=Paenibacillus montanisoli TaxID=2081970 RepID=A0A328U1Q8_9BACL|nr:hypothetical protein [Paenibacillus montanisoli]RAP76717.1 hypothetical protein DL346_15335 [Paenibacillus montanisoli]
MEEQKPKRPIFTPIVLILLTFSLIGNVFLYARSLQHGKDQRIERGMTILQSGKETKLHFEQVTSGLDDLLNHEDMPTRLAAKSLLIAAYNKSSAVTAFIKEAETSNGTPFASSNRNAATFLEQAEKSLQALGNHTGPLTDEERSYLKTLLAVNQACATAMASFKHDTISDTTAMTIQVDKAWVQSAQKLAEQMNKPANVIFTDK